MAAERPLARAYHEAGHAVVALALGHEVTALSLDECHSEFVESPGAWFAGAVVAMAGPAAQMRFAGEPEDVWRWDWDYATAEQCLGKLVGATLLDAAAEADRLIERHWHTIAWVAASLAEGEVTPEWLKDAVGAAL
jgi:hypothetical protein